MQCIICFEDYSTVLNHRPKLLPCGHDFCEMCIDGLHQQVNGRYVKCPKCNAQHTLLNPQTLPLVFSLIKDACELNDNVQRKYCHIKGCTSTAPENKLCLHCTERYCSDHEREHYSFLMKTYCKESEELARKRRQEFHIKLRNVKENQSLQDEVLQDLERQKNELIQRIEALKVSRDTTSKFQNYDQRLEKMTRKLQAVMSEEGTNVNKLWRKRMKLSNYLDEIAHESEELEARRNSVYMDQGNNEERTGMVDGDIPSMLLKSIPSSIVNISGGIRPNDIAIWSKTDRYSVVNGSVVAGSNGKMLLSPAILMSIQGNGCQVIVIDESGDKQGIIQLKLNVNNAELNEMCVRDKEQELLLSDTRNSCVWRLTMSGEILARSKAGIISDLGCCGLCLVGSDRIAVCDDNKGVVQFLQLPSLDKHSTLQHPRLSNPTSILSSKTKLFVLNVCIDHTRKMQFCIDHTGVMQVAGKPKVSSKLLIFSLENNTLISETMLDAQIAQEVVLVEELNRLFITDSYRVHEFTASGKLVGSIGKEGNGKEDFNRAIGQGFFTSSDNCKKLVVSDSFNNRLKFYAL